ncbi:MAG TPA: holo-ACP synthase [Clostridia bacterium]|nr:holo-ACP synthase [Clostridia bacterium]
MELFVGTDIIEVERIKTACEKNSKFLEKVFTTKEVEYFNSKKSKWPHIAGFFSAKESVAKLLGTGVREFKWQDVEILHNKLGAPVVVLKGEAQNIALKKGIKKIKLSISHTRFYAMSFAVAIGGEKSDSIDVSTNEGS